MTAANQPIHHAGPVAGGGRLAPRWVGVAALLTLMALGGALRFVNLGALTYQVDESFQLIAVQATLEHGLPKLDSGHAYTRAPLFIATQVLAAKAVGLSPLALRLPAAVFGVLCIPVALWFGRRLVGPRVGWALAAMLAFSQWHVEFSRYGRFYTLLMLVVMLALLAFHAGYLQKKFWPKLAFWVLALVAVTLHDAAVSLGMCFVTLLPDASRSWRSRVGLLVQAGVVGASWVGYRRALKSFTQSISDPALELIRKQPDALNQAQNQALAFIPGLKLPSLFNTDSNTPRPSATGCGRWPCRRGSPWRPWPPSACGPGARSAPRRPAPWRWASC